MTHTHLRLAAAIAALSPTLSAQYGWREPGLRPAGRAAHVAFFDPVRGRTTVFGGQVGELASGYDGDTLQVDGEGFVRMAAPLLPPRGYGACCDDPVTPGSAIVFGGNDHTGGLVPDTLRWNRELARFEPLAPAHTPPLRWITAMALDTARRRAVLFGGGDQFGSLSDTWEWDGTDWVQRFPAQSPTPRANHCMAYDAARGRVVLFGGFGAGNLGDTWLYDGTTWTQASTPFAPPPRHDAMMAYDASVGMVVLYGGKDANGTLWQDLWFWNGSQWSGPTSLAGPGRRELGTLTWDPVRQRLVLVGGVDPSGARRDDAWELGYFTGWSQLAPRSIGTPAPAHPVAGHAAAYDSLRGRIVSFGGNTSNTTAVYNQTIETDASSWVVRQPASSPPGRTGAKMAYDPAGNRVLMIGGRGISAPWVDGLWSWNGTAWSQVSAAAPPFVHTGHAVAFDAFRRRLVVFGGQSTFGVVSDLWEYDATAGWSLRNYALPVTPRQGHAMAYHPLLGKTFVFGGTLQNGVATDQLLAWDGTTMTLLAPFARPPAVTDAAMCYDLFRDRLVLFGGVNGSFANDTIYEFDGTNWIQRAVAGDHPIGRGGATIVYDNGARRCVLHGGYAGSTFLEDVWEWDGATGTWTRRALDGVPPPRGKGAIAYDATRGRRVVFGGLESQTSRMFADTWEWDGGSWTPKLPTVAPPNRWGTAMAFEQVSARTVLFGGRDGDGILRNDVWTWDGASWAQAAGAGSAMAPRCNHAMVGLSPLGGVVLFGGADSFNTSMGDAWLWNGTSWSALPAGPPARNSHAMAYDSQRRKVVVFGGNSFVTFMSDTWELDVTTWTWAQRTPAHSPSGRYNHAMSFDAARGRVVLSGGYNGVWRDDVWEWDGVDWQQRTPETTGPAPSEGAMLVHDRARGRTVQFGNWAPVSTNALHELGATIDLAGIGTPSHPSPLRSYSQPVLGQPLRLGFDMPMGFGIYLIGFGPVQQPRFQLGGPPTCEATNVFANQFTFLAFGGGPEPNVAWNVPNSPLILGYTLVFQGSALQSTNCFRATDALQVTFR